MLLKRGSTKLNEFEVHFNQFEKIICQDGFKILCKALSTYGPNLKSLHVKVPEILEDGMILFKAALNTWFLSLECLRFRFCLLSSFCQYKSTRSCSG